MSETSRLINEVFAGGTKMSFSDNRKSSFGRENGPVALQSYTRVKCVAARITPRG